MVSVPRLWPGATVVCLASGPSLTPEDVDYVRGKARVIAINDTVRLAPWADVLYSSDRYWWQHHGGVLSFTGPKFCVGSDNAPDLEIRACPDVRVLRNTGLSGLEVDPSGLRTGKNSGYAAVNLAVHLGASRVILLGYDMGASPLGRRHFFGDHPRGLNNPTPDHFSWWIGLFDSIVEPLAAAGVSVVNCTRRTALSCFPLDDLRSALTSDAREAA